MDEQRRRPTFEELVAREEAGAKPRELWREAGLAPDEVERVLAAVATAGDALARFGEWLRSGQPEADWFVALLPVSFTEAERLAAVRRILGRMSGPPIHRKRWNENAARFRAALEDFGCALDERVQFVGWEAVATQVANLTPRETVAQDEQLLRPLRTTLERLICEDLLGPGWRRHDTREAPMQDAIGAAPDERRAALEARAEVEALLDRAALTEGERRVLDLDLEGLDGAEIAARLSTTSGAVKQRRAAAMRKLRGAAQPE